MLLQEGAQDPREEASMELSMLHEQHAMQATELAQVMQKLDQTQVIFICLA